MRIAINGLGRIGRHIFRMAYEKGIEIAFINEPFASAKQIKILLQHDSTYGNFLENLQIEKNYLVLPNNKRVKIYSEKTFTKLDVSNIDILVESSGKIPVKDIKEVMNSSEKEIKTVITCDVDEEVDKNIIFGVNEEDINKNVKIISTSTCDGNALTPVLKSVLKYGIKEVSIVSLHPYLSNQQLLDNTPSNNNGKSDSSLWRSAVDNLIPKNTSAASVCEKSLPPLQGKVVSYQMRVPTSCVSAAFIDIDFEKEVNEENIISSLKAVDKKIIQINDEELVSKDFSSNSHSAIVDLRRCIIKGNKARLLIWYDNEVGYCSRVIDVLEKIILS